MEGEMMEEITGMKRDEKRIEVMRRPPSLPLEMAQQRVDILNLILNMEIFREE